MDEALAVERDLVGADTWAPPLSKADFLARECALRACPWSQSAREGLAWVSSDGVLASCERYRLEAPGDRPVVGIASVLTAPNLRGRGHASDLLRALVADGPPDAAHVLFSDIGPAIYARIGFAELPAWEVAWPAQEGPSDADMRAAPPAWSRPARRLRPSVGHLGWFHLGARHTAAALGLADSPWVAAVLDDATLVWADDVARRRLLVLALDAPDPRQAAQLIAAARAEAARLGRPEVVAWKTSDLPDGPTRRRAGSLPMVHGAADWTWEIERGAWV